MLKIGDQFEVTIEKMSLRGGGIAKHDGLVIFVDFAAPEDHLLVELIELKKNHAFARIKNIISPGPNRRNAPCPHFGKCGGCQWQHLTEEAQSKWKQDLVRDSLERSLKVAISFEPFCESPRPLRYRNRIQLKKQGFQVGYFQPGSHNLVSIEDCLLAEEALLPLLDDLRKAPPAKETQNWELALLPNGKSHLSQIDQREPGFSQVNRFVNDLLTEEVLSWSSRTPWTRVWDLYSGAGNFSFPLLKRAPQRSSIAVELSEESVLLGRTRAQQEGWSLKRIQFYCADVATFLRRQSPGPGDLIIVDPPRAGLDSQVAKILANVKAEHLLYISCDPASLARDLKILTANDSHWKIGRVRCFDMFPQTDHVETLAELIRKD